MSIGLFCKHQYPLYSVNDKEFFSLNFDNVFVLVFIIL